MEQDRKSLLLGLSGFIFTMLGITSLITLQFIWVYLDELSKKQIDTVNVLNFVCLSFLNLLIVILPTGIVVMMSLYYRRVFKDNSNIPKMSQTFFFPLILSAISFIWISFALPKIKLYMVSLLYDIQITAPEEPLKRTEITVFENLVSSKNYFELTKMIDSLETTNANDTEVGSAIFGMSKTKEAKIAKAKMITFPLFIFIVANLGIFLGVLNRKGNIIIFLLSIYFIFFPLSYYLPIYFEKLSIKSNLSPILGQSYNVIFWAVVTSLIGLYMIRKLKTEVNCC